MPLMDGSPTIVLDRAEALVAELHRLDIRHLARFQTGQPENPMPPAGLLAGLAASPDARLQAALILLFLRHPSYSASVPAAIEGLDGEPANTLRLYYQAAAYLRRDLEADLRQYSDDLAPLPDLFSAALGLPAPGSVATERALTALGETQARLSGLAYNWTGAYRQNIPRFLKHLSRPHGHHQPPTDRALS
jgi:hypothetical protein